jgi:hypothetical protein
MFQKFPPKIINSRTIALIALFFSFDSFAQDLNPNLWNTHKNKEFGFRISYPNHWEIILPKGQNIRISISPKAGPGNCNVVAKQNNEIKDMSQLQLNKELELMPIDDASWADYLGMNQSQFAITERRRVKIGNIPAIVGYLEANFETLEGRYFGKKIVAMTFTPGLMWSVTCGVSTYKTEEGKRRFKDIQPYLMKIMGSFRFF